MYMCVLTPQFQSLRDEIWNYLDVPAGDDYAVSDDDDLLECVARKDGAVMDDDDDAALLPYAGMLSLVSKLSSALTGVPAAGNLDAPLTGEHGDEDKDEGVGSFGGVVLCRKDGAVMDDEDDAALLEFGGLATIFSILTSTPIVGDIEGSPTGGAKFGRRSEPFGGVARRDGAAMDNEDDLALLEFAPLFYLHLAGSKVFGEADPDTCLADVVFGGADDSLSGLGEAWGADGEEAATWTLRRADGSSLTAEDDEALLNYGAWACAGTVALAIWSRTVGSLGDVSLAAGSAAGSLKRKPSGAELSAYLGYAAHASMGLSDPKRKVHARGIM